MGPERFELSTYGFLTLCKISYKTAALTKLSYKPLNLLDEADI